MTYCSKCRMLSNGAHCPQCGAENQREPLPQDRILIFAGEQKHCDKLALLLKKENIECEVQWGDEVHPDFCGTYVRYCNFENAKELALGGGFNVIEEEPPTQAYEETGYEEYNRWGRAKLIFWRVFGVVLFLMLVWGVVLVVDFFMNQIKEMF